MCRCVMKGVDTIYCKLCGSGYEEACGRTHGRQSTESKSRGYVDVPSVGSVWPSELSEVSADERVRVVVKRFAYESGGATGCILTEEPTCTTDATGTTCQSFDAITDI